MAEDDEDSATVASESEAISSFNNVTITTTTDRQQRRFEIAKSALQGIITSQNIAYSDAVSAAMRAVQYADALLAELEE